ncbi:MAG: hypothetical protein ACTH6N_09990, partial [Brachybacterium tyrofermentans]
MSSRSTAVKENAALAHTDPRRSIPRTDHLLDLPEVITAGERLSQSTIRAIIVEAQKAARAGE